MLNIFAIEGHERIKMDVPFQLQERISQLLSGIRQQAAYNHGP